MKIISGRVCLTTMCVKSLQCHTQHCDKMCRGGEQDEDVPHFVKPEHAGFEVEEFNDVHRVLSV